MQGQVGAAKTEFQVNGALRGTSQFQPMIDTSAARHGLDPIMYARQLHAESGLDPNVKDSPAGAQGIAQFMPDTARRFGVDVRSASSSIEGGAAYMDWLLQQPYIHGNIGLALAGYNWGEGHVQAWEASGFNPRQGPPKETRDYVQKITGQSIGDWIAGTRPNFNELGYPASTGGGRQRAVAIAQQAWVDPSVPPSQRQLNGTAADNAIQKWDLNNIRLANVTEIKQKAVDEKLLDDTSKDIISEQPQLTEQMIRQMPGPENGGPSYSAKERAIKLISRADMPEVPKNVSDANTMDLYKRITLPEGDPNKITAADVNPLRDAYGNHLISRESLDWLTNKVRDPDGTFLKQRHAFSAAVTSAIDKSSLGLPDPEGKLRGLAFEQMVDAQIAAWRADKKDPTPLITPGNPNYLGRPEIIHQPQWQPSMEDQVAGMRDRLQRGMPSAPLTPGQVIPPAIRPAAAATGQIYRKPGESMDEYDRRTGTR
jgi:hypothetical protein